MYLIFNYSKRCYVAKLGLRLSFTRSLDRARRYETLEAAQADCCGDEHVVNLNSLLRR